MRGPFEAHSTPGVNFTVAEETTWPAGDESNHEKASGEPPQLL